MNKWKERLEIVLAFLVGVFGGVIAAVIIDWQERKKLVYYCPCCKREYKLSFWGRPILIKGK